MSSRLELVTECEHGNAGRCGDTEVIETVQGKARKFCEGGSRREVTITDEMVEAVHESLRGYWGWDESISTKSARAALLAAFREIGKEE